MEYVISALVGGIIAGLAMIFNSYFNSRIARDNPQHKYISIYKGGILRCLK